MKKNTIIMVFHMNIYPILHGNQRRVKAFIEGVRSFGYKIILIINVNNYGVLPKGQKLKKIISEMKKMVDILIPVNGPLFAGRVDKFDTSVYANKLEQAVLKYDPIAVVAEYIWMAPCLDIVKNGAIKIVDTHDLMHVRKSMYTKKGLNPWAMCTKKQETDLLKKADVIIAIQKHEQKKLKEMVPGKKVIYIPHFPGVNIKTKRKDIKKDIIMTIGSSNSSNIYSLKKFLDISWPLIKKGNPKAELHVYGNVGKTIKRDIGGIIAQPYVRSLKVIYDNARVVINPTSIGTGLKIKTVEALSHKKALVTTKSGAEGLEQGSGRAFIVTNDLKRFAKEVLRLLKDNSARKKLEREALKFAKLKFSKKAVFGDLIKVLKKKQLT